MTRGTATSHIYIHTYPLHSKCSLQWFAKPKCVMAHVLHNIVLSIFCALYSPEQEMRKISCQRVALLSLFISYIYVFLHGTRSG